MKTPSTVLLAFIAALLAIPWNAEAQARKLTERIVNPDKTLATPNNRSAPAQPRVTPSATPVPVVTTVVPEKTKAQKDETMRKTVEFQKKRAEAGAPTAQYDLAMRYLKGDGVEKNLALAGKWINASATNGHSQAVKKLEELTKHKILPAKEK